MSLLKRVENSAIYKRTSIDRSISLLYRYRAKFSFVLQSKITIIQNKIYFPVVQTLPRTILLHSYCKHHTAGFPGIHISDITDIVSDSTSFVLQTLQSKIPLSHEVVLNHGSRTVGKIYFVQLLICSSLAVHIFPDHACTHAYTCTCMHVHHMHT